MREIIRRKTRLVHSDGLLIGHGQPILVQSMCATRTSNIEETVRQISVLAEHGAGLIRIAADSRRDIEALKEIRGKTSVPLAVDLQESYALATEVAPYVQKIRYNPGHLYHQRKDQAAFSKVKVIVEAAKRHNCALRIGINFGSLDPARKSSAVRPLEAALASAREHVHFMEELEFENFVVSLKSARPLDVIEANRRFAEEFDYIPLHLGVTEAGMLPMGEVKTRQALEELLRLGIGDTLRVSLTLSNERKHEEVLIGRRIVEDVYAGRFMSNSAMEQPRLNIISCPSCARVENARFVDLAEQVRELCSSAAEEDITIAVMGCRVNGPGESDEADLGLWCAPKYVNLKRGGQLLGAFSYDEVLGQLKRELENLIALRRESSGSS